MHLCYIDESGTPDLPGNTSHYILAGLTIPVAFWKECDNKIEQIKQKYELTDSELHAAWILRTYPEQTKIAGFGELNYAQCRSRVDTFRKGELLRLQRNKNSKLYRQTRKNYMNTKNYIHLTQEERRKFIGDVAKEISGWGFSRLFAECIDKVHFDPKLAKQDVDEQAFEQVISRFDKYLQATNLEKKNEVGLLIHDNNPTMAKKHTILMKKYHQKGTRWTMLKHIIEMPLFVSSELTSMVQIADLCGYALRRYLENKEEELFDLVFARADRRRGTVVGVRHFTDDHCDCKICRAHKVDTPPPLLGKRVSVIKKD